MEFPEALISWTISLCWNPSTVVSFTLVMVSPVHKTTRMLTKRQRTQFIPVWLYHGCGSAETSLIPLASVVCRAIRSTWLAGALAAHVWYRHSSLNPGCVVMAGDLAHVLWLPTFPDKTAWKILIKDLCYSICYCQTMASLFNFYFYWFQMVLTRPGWSCNAFSPLVNHTLFSPVRSFFKCKSLFIHASQLRTNSYLQWWPTKRPHAETGIKNKYNINIGQNTPSQQERQHNTT